MQMKTNNNKKKNYKNQGAVKNFAAMISGLN
jgi:hypothetical protein